MAAPSLSAGGDYRQAAAAGVGGMSAYLNGIVWTIVTVLAFIELTGGW
jgi:hypothetical protein